MKCFFPFKDKFKNKKGSRSAPAALKDQNKSDGPAIKHASKSSSSLPSPRSILDLFKEKENSLVVFSLEELREATNCFNRLLKIGEGGFGSVYKGTIRPPNGQGDPIIVAIKKFNNNSLQGHKEWLAEVHFIGVFNHTNLVKLLGYCSVDGKRGIQRLLVYEFMPNGSLDYHLFNRESTLDWKTRLEIILGAAQGLAYLHGGLKVPVIYRDFKPSNVLLGEELEAKLSDFALVREAPQGDHTHVSTEVAGTYGYIDPEYLTTGQLTIRSDIWSFGVVLYEILTGRRVLGRNRPTEEQNLLEWVKQFPVDSSKFSMIIDPGLRNQYSLGAARKIAKLADRCLNKTKDRPTINEVVESLKQALQVSEEGITSGNRSSESSKSKFVPVLMLGGLGLTEPPMDEEWEKAKVIHLMHNELSGLPENPRCPKLLALFLQRNYKLRMIPPSFFDYMPALEVLNLSRTGIRSLPKSLIRLVSLKRLFLNDCPRFMMLLPEVGELKQLEVLDLEGTEIMYLPEEIKKLTNLTCLEVSIYGDISYGRRGMQSNAMVPPGIVSALSQVEELNIDVNPDDERWDACVEAIVSEACSLVRLNTLKLYFPRVELLRHFEVFSSLSHFRFIVGRHAKRIMSRLPRDVEFELDRWDRCLKYINGEGVVPEDIKKVLKHATAIFLERHANIKKLSELGIENMEQLKCCVVGECNEVQVIIDEADACEEDDSSEIVAESHGDKKIILGSLEYLYIYYMKSLRSIWEGPLEQKCLFLLKSLTLCTCPQLTTIFTQGLLDNLCNLEELTVEDCPIITSLVSCKISAEYKDSYFLPKLKRITLHYVPELVSISAGLHIAPKLEWMSFYNCPNLKKLSVEEVSSKDLKKIKGERSWWEALEWTSSLPGYLDGIFVPIDIIN